MKLLPILLLASFVCSCREKKVDKKPVVVIQDSIERTNYVGYRATIKDRIRAKTYVMCIGNRAGQCIALQSHIIIFGNFKDTCIDYPTGTIYIDQSFPYFKTEKGKHLLYYINGFCNGSSPAGGGYMAVQQDRNAAVERLYNYINDNFKKDIELYYKRKP